MKYRVGSERSNKSPVKTETNGTMAKRWKKKTRRDFVLEQKVAPSPRRVLATLGRLFTSSRRTDLANVVIRETSSSHRIAAATSHHHQHPPMSETSSNVSTCWSIRPLVAWSVNEVDRGSSNRSRNPAENSSSTKKNTKTRKRLKVKKQPSSLRSPSLHDSVKHPTNRLVQLVKKENNN